MLVLETGSRIVYELFYVDGCLTMKRNCLPLASTWGEHLGEHMGWPSWRAHGVTILASTWGSHLGEHMRWPSVYMGFVLLIVLFFSIVFFVLFIFVPGVQCCLCLWIVYSGYSNVKTMMLVLLWLLYLVIFYLSHITNLSILHKQSLPLTCCH